MLNDNINSFVEKLKEKRIKIYENDPDLIISDYRNEYKEIKGYHGREILELLQNAVDEMGEIEDKKAFIKLKNNILTISNNGKFFSEEGIKSLMYSNHSPKYEENDYIGNKGTGFRSILNWAEKIRVYSGDLSIEFSPNYAEKVFNKKFKNREEIKGVVKSTDSLPTLVCPKIIDSVKKNYDTLIEIELKNNVTDDVESQLKKIKKNLLVFLENLEHLIIIYGDMKKEFKKNIIDENKILLKEFKNSKFLNDEEYLIKRNSGTIKVKNDKDEEEDKKWEIAIAYKGDNSIEPENLYSYFETEEYFPIPALVHGTFELGANRNHLLKTDTNKKILEEIVYLLVDVAKDISKKDVSYDPLNLLIFEKGDFNNLNNNFDFENYLLDIIAESELFPTINKSYIKIDDAKFYEKPLSKFLNPDIFDKCLIHTPNEKIIDFVNRIIEEKNIDYSYNYNYIVKNLDFNISLEDRANFFVLFWEYYEKNMANDENKLFLKFLLDENGNSIISDLNNEKYIFFPPKGKNSNVNPPVWSNITFLNNTLINEIKNLKQISTDKHLKSAFKFGLKLDLKIYDLMNIIETLAEKSRDNKEHNIELIDYIYKNRDEFSWKKFDSSNVQIISKTGSLYRACDMYFGEEYGNEIIENLFFTKKDYLICEPSVYNIAINEKNDFKNFLKELKINSNLKDEDKTIEGIVENSVDSYIKEVIKNIDSEEYPIKAKGVYNDNANIYKNKDELSIDYLSIDVKIFKFFEDIINNSSTKAILSYLNQYPVKKFSENIISTQQRQQQKNRSTDPIEILNYPYYKLKTSEWIEINGKKYAPEKCTIDKRFKDLNIPNFVYLDVNNFLNYEIQDESLLKEKLKNLKDLFIYYGVHEDFSDLSLIQIYSLLLKLPNFDKNGEISKKLYKKIINTENKSFFFKSLSPQDNYEDYYNKNDEDYIFSKFIAEGKVWCKNREFLPLKYVQYELRNSNLKKFNFIDIEKIKNDEEKYITERLGIGKFEIPCQIEEKSIHELNDSFIEDYIHFKPCALSYITSNIEKAEKIFKNLQVQLCDKIIIDYDGIEQVKLNNNEFFISSNKNIFLKVDKNLKDIMDLKNNLDFSDSIANSLIEILNISTNNSLLVSNFRPLYEANNEKRKKMVFKDNDEDSLIKAEKKLFLKNHEAKLIKSDKSIVSEKSLKTNLNDNFNIQAHEKHPLQLINSNKLNEKEQKYIKEEFNPEVEPSEANVIVEDFKPKISESSKLDSQKKSSFNYSNKKEKDIIIKKSPKIISDSKKKIGDYGEKIVLNELKREYSDTEYEIIDLNENSVGIGRDFEIRKNDELIGLIEVKSTKESNKKAFEISAKQWEKAKNCYNDGIGDKYWIYCVFNTGNKNQLIKRVKNPFKKWKDGELKVNPTNFLIELET